MSLESGVSEGIGAHAATRTQRVQTAIFRKMRKLEDLFEALSGSRFRSKFKLGPKERAYLHTKGRAAVARHAAEMIARRLAPANPARDGKQTPMRGHPVFVAQHATATCCRGCLEKWHGIERGRALSAEEQAYVVNVIASWIEREDPNAPEAGEPSLFD
jgi:hypothetical protein